MSIPEYNLRLKICKFSEFSFLRNPYYHHKDRSLLKAGLASETPTGNGINPIGDTICIGTYRQTSIYICV